MADARTRKRRTAARVLHGTKRGVRGCRKTLAILARLRKRTKAMRLRIRTWNLMNQLEAQRRTAAME